jgi:mono/diheme cytochrome c family protein
MNQYLGKGVLICGLALASLSAQAGNVDKGGELARNWCAQCHVVDDAQTRVTDAGPAFAQIANNPAKSRLGLSAWLADPHPPMPNLNLTQDEIDDLVAYIKSLKTN